MAVNHYFNVFSNDGSTTLFTSANTVNNSTIITVTETGLTIGTETYTYSGTKKFIGVSGLANSTSPGYAIGESFDGGEDSVYIVEEEPTTSAVTVEYNGLVIATIPNGKMATVSCNGKKMTTDVVIEVPTATDSSLPFIVSTEAEMTALLQSGTVGGIYKYTGETTDTYENGALYVLETSGFNLTLSGGLGGFTSGGGNTYIKINSQPTSSSDYDYDAKSLSSSGSVTVQATSYWYWDTSFGDTYATATEVALTEDKSAMYSYYNNGGSND